MKYVSIALALALSCAAAGPDSEKGKTMGNLSAPVRFDLYSDFTCPHCKLFHDTILPRIADDFISTGKAYLVFHEYVLQGQGHEHSRTAATYAAAAAHMGKYAQVAGALFLNQQSWAVSGKVWEAIAPVLTPAERTKIQALAKDPAIAADVVRDTVLGNSSKVDRTPTVVVTRGSKATPWSWWENYALFKSLVNDQLK
jgi:protein-disulfide isomerase